MESRHLSVVIAATPETVYAFASDPANLPQWAAGLAQSEVIAEGDMLRMTSPMGDVIVRFTPANDLGVLDHVVELPDGTSVLNPLRVVAHPEGAEVVFTVRQLAMTSEEFDHDAGLVTADLATLKRLLESPSAPGSSHVRE